MLSAHFPGPPNASIASPTIAIKWKKELDVQNPFGATIVTSATSIMNAKGQAVYLVFHPTRINIPNTSSDKIKTHAKKVGNVDRGNKSPLTMPTTPSGLVNFLYQAITNISPRITLKRV